MADKAMARRSDRALASRAQGLGPRGYPLGYHNMGSGGRCDWTYLREAVAEATSGSRAHSRPFDPTYYPGHQMVEGLNYNSLDRIVTAFVDAALLARDSDGSASAARPGTGLDPKDDSAAIAQTPVEES